jgi:hypothetical protein
VLIVRQIVPEEQFTWLNVDHATPFDCVFQDTVTGKTCIFYALGLSADASASRDFCYDTRTPAIARGTGKFRL